MKIFRGDIFSFKNTQHDYQYIIDGALVVVDGMIVEVGKYSDMRLKYPDAAITDYTDKLIMPGFIDTHTHFVQMEIIGMYGKQLLEWLSDYTFPAEQAFESEEYAARIANAFLKELWRNGTTSCLAYSSVHRQSADALFNAADKANMRVITGNTLMERNAAEGLEYSAEDSERDSRELIEKWHGKGRSLFAITPRFAITCSERQLLLAGKLHNEFPDTYVQTHLSENKAEIGYTLSLFDGCKDYLEVYERAGLITDRSVLAHCIHLSDDEISRIANVGAIISHCPTSNLFLGSGLFNMKAADENSIHTTIGTDIGAGTSFSMLKTMGEAYKVSQLRDYPLTAFDTFYKSTLGAAKALHLDDKVGSLQPKREADFIVVEYAATEVERLRADYLKRTDRWCIENILFGLQTLGDDRNIAATYIMGKLMN